VKLFLITLFSILIPISVFGQSSGRDRCAVRDCLCSVLADDRVERNDQVIRQNRRYGIFFQEDEFEISSYQDVEISNLLSINNHPHPNITIIGYTDGCGEREYNRNLASNRANTIKLKILEEVPSARISIQVEEEETSNHNPDSRRVDIIFHTLSSLSTSIEKIPADVYLVDGSGSMWEEWGTWRELVNTSFAPGNRIYLSMMTGCRNGQSINSVDPQGGTEIWYSYWKVLEYMEEGETLLIISDFDTDIPLSQYEANLIENKAIGQGVRVKVIMSSD